MNKDNKGFRPMSDDDDMSDKTMKSGYNRISKGGMMPESNMKPNDDMLSKTGKTGKGNMMSDNMMPKSDTMPMDNMMPKSNAMPMENMMPKNNAMPMDNMMPKSNTMPMENMMPKSNAMPMDNMAPKSNAMPMDNMMPKSNAMPMENMMPKSNAMPMDNMMPKSNATPMDNMAPKSNTMPKGMTKANQNAMNSVENQSIQYKALYPEVFYKVKPYVLMVCDELENMGQLTPNQEDIDNIADNICADVCDMYPELNEYVEQTEAQETFVPFYGRRFGQPFRRRGIFNDLVGIMLLSELFGRRRGRYW